MEEAGSFAGSSGELRLAASELLTALLFLLPLLWCSGGVGGQGLPPEAHLHARPWPLRAAPALPQPPDGACAFRCRLPAAAWVHGASGYRHCICASSGTPLWRHANGTPRPRRERYSITPHPRRCFCRPAPALLLLLQIVLREEATEPKRRTRIVPMLMERQKLWDMREAAGVGEKQQRQR